MYNRNNRRNKYYNVDKPNLSVPDLPLKPAESTIRPVKTVTGIRPNSDFQKIRDYDAKLNTIDINITGAAPIFGADNPIQTTPLLNQSQGLFTGSINDAYAQDDFLLLSTVKRDIKLNYWGMNIQPFNDKLLANKSFYTWESNVQFLESKIKEAMYTDLAVFSWQFQSYTQSSAAANGFSQYDKVMSPLSYVLYCYQMNIYSLMITILNFEYIVSQLPKLQELYKGKSDYFVHIQNQLKRSAFTAPLRALMTWLKKRYIDQNFFTKYILPTAVVSKATDGLNSPIVYLSQTLVTPLQPIVKVNYQGTVQNVTSTIPTVIFGDKIKISRDRDNLITKMEAPGMTNGLYSITHNAFDLDTLLQLVLSSPKTPDFKTEFSRWMNTALNVIATLNAQTLDLSRESWFVDLEAALSKLATNPGAMNWKQNVNFTALPPVIKYTNYQLVNDLVTFACSRPEYSSSNSRYTDTGYRMLIPMFRRKGLPEQLIYNMSQVYYLESNEIFYSVISLGDTIQFRTRDNTVVKATIEYVKDNTYNAYVPIFKLDQAFNTQAYLVLQDYFTFVEDKNNTMWVNPDFMTFVTASYQNAWAEFVIEATQNFVIPQA